ncbi:MAG: hypothetical protein K2O18_08190 [Oscillospiraceae bacterium]|nr:hypothetical protein [Oscillospiraceae bacterium]
MSSSAIVEFGKMLAKVENILTVGEGGPIFAWAAPGDIAICGKAPEDFNGRVCLVKFPDEETSMICRLYKDGENVRVGYMDDYDIWKSYPADAITIRYEVLAVVHQYGSMELPKDDTAWKKRVELAAWGALDKFCLEDYDQLRKHHRGGHTFETLAAAFSIGFQAGIDETGRKIAEAEREMMDAIRLYELIALIGDGVLKDALNHIGGL